MSSSHTNHRARCSGARGHLHRAIAVGETVELGSLDPQAERAAVLIARLSH